MYFRECPHCGCHLDPGEMCDCQSEQEKAVRYVQGLLILERNTKQYTLKLDAQESASA